MGKTNLSHDGLNPAHVPYWWVNNPTLGEFCFAMIGRADIEGSKSNVAMNAWLPQASYPCEAMQTSLDLKMDSLIQNVRSRTADNFKVFENVLMLRTIGRSAKHMNQMSEPAVPLVLSRITIATTYHSRVKLTCLTTV
uniref:Bm342 n=2 Tax=Brugia malayi TaxID=6279 RepID=A0A0J9XRG6_BRUMA|nr:Bm342 [Brugia malayi]